MPDPTSTRTQIIRFLIVSSVSLVIDWSVYALLSYGFDIDSSWAKRVSFACILVWGFLAHKRFTFRQERIQASEPIKFGLLYLVGWMLNSVIHDLAAKDSAASTSAFLMATFAWACLNFTVQKYLVFAAAKNRKTPTSTSTPS